jgi:hypothetical protein
MLRHRLRAGSRFITLDLGVSLSPAEQAPLHLDPLPDDDWFFQTMREAIAENRRRESRRRMFLGIGSLLLLPFVSWCVCCPSSPLKKSAFQCHGEQQTHS